MSNKNLEKLSPNSPASIDTNLQLPNDIMQKMAA